MHPIVNNAFEADLFTKAFGTVGLGSSCNIYINDLCRFWRDILVNRFDKISYNRKDFEEVKLVHWDQINASDDWEGPHTGRLHNYYDTINRYPEDDDKHPTCLFVSHDMTWYATVPTREYTGKYKWLSLNDVLDHANDQFKAVYDRIMTIKNIIDKNAGSIYIHVSSYSTGGRIQTSFNIKYRVHIYDTDAKEPCPHHANISVREIAG